ncbi:MAG: hypothetical protein FD170_426 [Bacteroidetes bacterium]|nr:MAG: hypothetical protein FD170_426 [Bacteroidota bacterium]
MKSHKAFFVLKWAGILLIALADCIQRLMDIMTIKQFRYYNLYITIQCRLVKEYRLRLRSD